MHIEISTDTIEKLLKPIEGKHLDEDEMQEALKDTLTNLLPTDTKVNEEAAKPCCSFRRTLKRRRSTIPGSTPSGWEPVWRPT